MALSNAEKVRRYRERQKEKKQSELKQPTPRSTLFRTPFFEFFTEDEQLGSAYMQSLEFAGFQPVPFDDDTGPEASTLDDLQDSDPFGAAKGSSLGKAEVIIGCLLDAANDLALRVRDYKRSEIQARIAEIEASDLSDAAVKKNAFAEVARLTKLLEQLDKQMRYSLPVYKVADEAS